MGCCQGAQTASDELRAPRPCRRQRGGGAKGGTQRAGTEVAEGDCYTLIADRNNAQMMGKTIASCTDDSKIAFGEKSVQGADGQLSPEANLLGYTCRKGLKPESPNQDSWLISKVCNHSSIYGVFDGHGEKGHDVSNFVKDTLPQLMVNDQRWNTDELHPMMKDAFRNMQDLVGIADINASLSGTTASVVIHDHKKNKLTVAHVADSTAVLGRFKDKDKRSKDDMEAVALTRDHRPNLEHERARIEGSGGSVVFDGYANLRVYAKDAGYPGLTMSRCIGDLRGHQDCGITAEPEVSEVPIQEEDHVLLVCSDGVWEFIQPSDAVKIVSNYSPTDAMKAARALAQEAWDRWIMEEDGEVVDDITVLVVYLNEVPSL